MPFECEQGLESAEEDHGKEHERDCREWKEAPSDRTPNGVQQIAFDFREPRIRARRLLTDGSEAPRTVRLGAVVRIEDQSDRRADEVRLTVAWRRAGES